MKKETLILEYSHVVKRYAYKDTSKYCLICSYDNEYQETCYFDTLQQVMDFIKWLNVLIEESDQVDTFKYIIRYINK